MVFQHGSKCSKATQQDHGKKKLLTTTAAWHGPMCPLRQLSFSLHDFLNLHKADESVVANGCKLGRLKHA